MSHMMTICLNKNSNLNSPSSWLCNTQSTYDTDVSAAADCMPYKKYQSGSCTRRKGTREAGRRLLRRPRPRSRELLVDQQAWEHQQLILLLVSLRHNEHTMNEAPHFSKAMLIWDVRCSNCRWQTHAVVCSMLSIAGTL